MKIRPFTVVTLVAAVLFGGTACAADSSPVAPLTIGTAATRSPSVDTDWLARGGCRPAAADPSDAASAGTVLTVRAGGRATPVTMTRLDALPQVECTVDDRQAEGRTVTFRGPLLADVLAAAGVVPADGATLHTLAVNDYAVDLPASDVRDYPVLLATRADGRPMTVAHYGPLRVVYPTSGFDLDPTVYDPRWIWQLTEITL